MKIILPFVLVFFFFRSRYLPFRFNTYPLLSLENFSLFAMQLSIYRCRTTQTYLQRQSLSSYAFLFSLGTSLGFCFRSFFSPVASRPLYLRTLVGSNGLGPSTSRLSGVCSNQLSYEPILVEVIGFEPMTPCLQGRCSTN